ALTAAPERTARHERVNEGDALAEIGGDARSVDRTEAGDVQADARSTPARSPGQALRHYAPRKPLLLLRRGEAPPAPRPGDAELRLPATPEAAAALLYAELHRLDADPAIVRIVASEPPDDPRWDAIRDRLRRAAHATDSPDAMA
ncbi:hypothetical protein K2X89_07005, partial [Myxococcota bacterium]|nr:hypothetical protein [Myxococcota bacterium]